MKKRELEISTFRFISEVRIVIDNLEREAVTHNYKEFIWDALKSRLKGDNNMKWIVKEMNSIDEFIDREEVKEFIKKGSLNQII